MKPLIKFNVTHELFDTYLIDLHEPQTSLWWKNELNWDRIQVFQARAGDRYVCCLYSSQCQKYSYINM